MSEPEESGEVEIKINPLGPHVSTGAVHAPADVEDLVFDAVASKLNPEGIQFANMVPEVPFGTVSWSDGGDEMSVEIWWDRQDEWLHTKHGFHPRYDDRDDLK